MKFATVFASLENLLSVIGAGLQHGLLLAIRLYWGWSCVQTGWGKLGHLERTANFFASLHIPLPTLNAAAAGGTELIGGALLALGLFSRFAAAGIGCVMVVAYLTADREAVLGIFSNPDKFLGADPFLFLYAALIVFAFGPGKLSLDGLLRRKPESRG